MLRIVSPERFHCRANGVDPSADNARRAFPAGAAKNNVQVVTANPIAGCAARPVIISQETAPGLRPAFLSFSLALSSDRRQRESPTCPRLSRFRLRLIVGPNLKSKLPIFVRRRDVNALCFFGVEAKTVLEMLPPRGRQVSYT
jgi:hypothetical protein